MQTYCLFSTLVHFLYIHKHGQLHLLASPLISDKIPNPRDNIDSNSRLVGGFGFKLNPSHCHSLPVRPPRTYTIIGVFWA